MSHGFSNPEGVAPGAARTTPAAAGGKGMFRATDWPPEIDNMLRMGQVGSTAGIVDLRTAAATQWTRGTTLDAPLSDAELASMAISLFARPARDDARGSANAAIAAMGGVRALIVRHREVDLFATVLTGTDAGLVLVMKHRDRSPAGSDMSSRARELAHALAISHGPDRRHAARHGPGMHDQGHAASLAFWQRLVGLFSGRFSAPAKVADARPGTAIAAARGSRWKGALESLCRDNEYVRFGMLVDMSGGGVLDAYLAGDASVDQAAVPRALRAAFDDGYDPWPLVAACNGGDPEDVGKLQIQVGKRDFYWLRVPYYPGLSIPFDPDRVLVLYKRPRPNSLFDWHAIDQAGLDILRERVRALLASGMKTQTLPFPRTQHEFAAIIEQLVQLRADDLIGRLDVGGFADHPVRVDDIDLRCQECIYFLPNRRWCDLPELPVPVEPDWYCRLWKI